MTDVSNCCGADILNPDSQGHGKCRSCKENCVPSKDFDDSWVDPNFMNWIDPSGDLQGKWDNMMKSADRIITRGKQIKEMETK
jgi:hypothetical protein